MKYMQRLSLLAIIYMLIIMPACKKSGGGGGGGGGTPPEANLVVETDPAADGTQKAPSPGPFPLKITIKSAMPASGVKVEVAAHPEGSTTNFFSVSANSSNTVNDYTITNTPLTVTCIVDITVTSISKPSNKWTGSYRYSRKP